MATKEGLGNSSVLTGLAVVVGGKNTFGKTGDVKLPDWEQEVVDDEATGIPKSPKITVPIFDLSEKIIRAFRDEESIVLRGNVRDEGDDRAVEISFSGQLHKMSPEFKEGEKTGRTFTVRLDVYEEKYNNVVVRKWNRGTLEDDLGGDGKNRLEQFAKNLGVR